MPANHSTAANPAALVLPDVLTELDLLAPLPDLGLMLSQPNEGFLGFGRADSSLLDFGSQVSSQIERGRRATTPLRLEDDEGLDLDLGTDVPTPHRERDIEAGRDAPVALSMLDDRDDTLKLYDADDLDLDLGLGQSEAQGRDSSIMPDIGMDVDVELPAMGGDDTIMGGMNDDLGMAMPNIDDELDLARTRRETESPLSSIRSSVQRDLEENVQQEEDPLDETVQQAQRVKKRKVLRPDSTTELSARDVRDQQNDRSKILRPASFLPRDPVLLALMDMQRTGGFVSNILGDGRSKGWAPELRGILSLEIVRQPAASSLKRKRDAIDAAAAQIPEIIEPELEIPPMEEDTGIAGGFDLGEDTSIMHAPTDDALPPLAAADDEDPLAVPGDDSSDVDAGLPADNFDDTTAPLLHPSDSGLVSIGTKHAVHMLRERFGPEGETSAEERARSSLLFQDMLPEKTTSRADATKMFFEVLVLATKDAVKVEQESGVLGGALRVRAKRGLWGDWAEMEAGGEIEVQQEDAGAAAVAV